MRRVSDRAPHIHAQHHCSAPAPPSTGLSVRTHFHEFLVWLDSERADSKTSWPEWHAAALSAQRRQSTGRRLQRVALSLIPKAIAFAGATAALRVDRFGHASFRSLLAFVYAARRPPPLSPHQCSADDKTSSLIRPTHGDKLQPESHELSCTHNTPALPERTHAACTAAHAPLRPPLPGRSERKHSTSGMVWPPAPPSTSRPAARTPR